MQVLDKPVLHTKTTINEVFINRKPQLFKYQKILFFFILSVATAFCMIINYWDYVKKT